MPDTLLAAKERIVRERKTAQFLTDFPIGKNVLWLKRDQKPYIPVVATIVGTTPNRIRIAIYASGQETRNVNPELLFTEEGDWCSGKPMASVMHCSDRLEGTVYHNRHKYIRRYELSQDSDDLEQAVLQDWLNNPDTFQEVKS